MIERTAQCNCGQLRAICTGEPARMSVCYCINCKRRTGSAFAYNATYKLDRVRTEGRSNGFSRGTDTGRTNSYRFCPDCGSTVYYYVELRQGMISIPAGAFADADFPPPTVEVYEHRKPKWCTIEISGE